jgi:uncharacterized membrane protein
MAHKARISAVVIVWLDLAVNVIHALAHIGANIWLSFFGNAFVVGVILVAPFVPPGVWQQPFQITAVLLTILQAAGTGIGIWCLSEAIGAHALRRAEIGSTVRERRVNGEM